MLSLNLFILNAPNRLKPFQNRSLLHQRFFIFSKKVAIDFIYIAQPER